MTVEAVISASGALGDADRLKLLRALLETYGPDLGSAVETFSSGSVVFATDDMQQRCESIMLVPGAHLLPRAVLAIFLLVGRSSLPSDSTVLQPLPLSLHCAAATPL
jgi:hypothetical protein